MMSSGQSTILHDGYVRSVDIGQHQLELGNKNRSSTKPVADLIDCLYSRCMLLPHCVCLYNINIRLCPVLRLPYRIRTPSWLCCYYHYYYYS